MKNTFEQTYYNLILEENIINEFENIINNYNPLKLEDAKKILEIPIIKQISNTLGISVDSFSSIISTNNFISEEQNVTIDGTTVENPEFKINENKINTIVSVIDKSTEQSKQSKGFLNIFKFKNLKYLKYVPKIIMIIIIATVTVYISIIYKNVSKKDVFEINKNCIQQYEETKTNPSALNTARLIDSLLKRNTKSYK